MKRCPYCDEKVRDGAIKCKHCGEMLDQTGVRSPDTRIADTAAGTRQRYDTLDAVSTRTSEPTILAGQYRIIGKIAEGGMGVVYLAEDKELSHRKVAIKVLPPILANNHRSIENLRREAITTINLNHPNIVRLYGFRSDGDIKFLVMEYIDGETLEARIAKNPHRRLSVEETAKIAESIGAALDYAHNQEPPVLHRDLKPSNIMISTTGQIKLLDFGIAREMKDSYTRVTGTQETSGTLPYMSPEQLRGKKPSKAMDIYSLGAVCYECLSGHTPFHTGDLSYQIVHERAAEVEGLPEHVNAALQRALSKGHDSRPRTALELVGLLKHRPRQEKKLPERPPVVQRPPVAKPVQPAAQQQHFPAETTPKRWPRCVAAVLLQIVGGGFFYLRSRAKRRFLYPVIFAYGAIDALLALSGVEPFKDSFGAITCLIAVGIIIVGMVDVLIVSLRPVSSTDEPERREAEKPGRAPKWLRCVIAVLLQAAGLGFFYLRSGVKRRYMYIFFAAYALVVLILGAGLEIDYFKYSYFSEMSCMVSLIIVGLGMIDVLAVGILANAASGEAEMRRPESKSPAPKWLRCVMAVLLQVVGLGFFYLRSGVKRRYMYIFFAAYALVILILLILGPGFEIDRFLYSYFGEMSFVVSLIIVGLGMIDVLAAAIRAKPPSLDAEARRAERIGPPPTWSKCATAVSLQLFGGGFFYLRSRAKRRYLYPLALAYMLMAFAVSEHGMWFFQNEFQSAMYIVCMTIMGLGLADVLAVSLSGNDEAPGRVQTAAHPGARTSRLAIVSLAMAMASCLTVPIGPLGFILGFVFFPPAVICGHLALRKIKNRNGELAGRSIAVTGLVFAYAMAALRAIAFLSIIGYEEGWW